MTVILPRIFGAIGTAWYLFGGTQFTKNLRLDPAAEVERGAMTQIHADAFISIPTFIWVFYGMAVVLGIAGGLQLIRLKSNAWLFFGASLFLDIIYFGWIRFIAYTFDAPPAEAGILALVVLTVGAVLTFLSIILSSLELSV